MMPGFFGSVNSRFLTPVNSIIITCLIIGLAVVYLDVEKIAKLASAFKVMMFIAVNLAVIVLRETSAQWYNPKYKSPFYPYVQLFGILSGFILLFYLDSKSYKLEQNYRSTKNIVQAANSLINHNILKLDKTIWMELRNFN